MSYTKRELLTMTRDILAYSDLKTTEQFKPHPVTGKMTKYEVDLTPKMQKQLFTIAQSILDIHTHEEH